MKKTLHVLWLALLTINTNAQTPIQEFNFNGSLTNSANSATFAVTGNSISYGADRNGVANSALQIVGNGGSYLTANLSNLPTGNAARSISIWYKCTDITANNYMYPFGYGTQAANQAFGLQQNSNTIGLNPNRVEVYGFGPTSNNVGVVGSAFILDQWYHYVITHDGVNTTKIYRNNLLLATFSKTWATTGTVATIGRIIAGAFADGQNITGLVDDLKIYNTELTTSQIATLFTPGSTTVGMPTVSNVSATNIGNTSATINYTINANNVATTTEVHYVPSAGGAVQIQAGPSASGSANMALSQVVSGLTPNTNYEYNVWAFNSEGTAFLQSSLYFTTTGTTTPAVITAVNASNITNVTATINFSLNTGGIATPTSVNYGTSAGALTSSVSGPIVTSSSAQPTTINLSSLNANTTYYYQVVAPNTNGIATSAVVSFTTLAVAPAPTPVYHFPFNGSLVATDGVTALAHEVNSGQFAFVNGNTALAFINNLNATPNFSGTLSNLPQGNSPRTVSVRLNFDTNALGSQGNNIFAWGAPVANQAYGWTQSSAAYGNNYLWGSGDVVFPNSMSYGTWYIMTFVFDGSSIKIYRDGVSLGDFSKTLNTAGTTFWLGSVLGGGQNFFNGFIDDLQIYNTALTQSQVTALNNAILSSESFNSNALNFRVYPNPANDFATIEIDEPIKSVEIYTLQGQRVLVSNTKDIDVSGLDSGVYLVKVEDENASLATQKLVIK